MSDVVAVVDFPLRGEWWAMSTPHGGAPGHGTDYFAQRYACDFVRLDSTGTFYYDGAWRSLLRHLTVGVPAARFFGWGAPVHAAAAGRVVTAQDGWPDIARVQLFLELVRSTFAPRRPRSGDHRPLAGNVVIVEGESGFTVYGHLRQGSVRVAPGQRLAAGDPIGAIGNSGNSTMPHLHFQLMDGPDPLAARGLPCEFRDYERWTGSAWERVSRGVPAHFERVRAG